ncbi:MAG TPA: His/Gly/Thr/Pro-type tRNA ligase C-terminal domain-containing protein, partial [Clostridia bacterium]|nr:His/Gly/Thr/Pro-type tRNA ligase C-terminal domain-containing protein [Clostridia bacterium]
RLRGFRLAHELRQLGKRAECDQLGRSLKAQLKYADKLGAVYVVAIGEDELRENRVKLKNMAAGIEIPALLQADKILQAGFNNSNNK